MSAHCDLVDSVRLRRTRRVPRGRKAGLEPSRILVVEDDEDLSFILGCRLDRAGFQVTAAVDGEAGLAKIATDAPHLILLDLWLPKLTGFKILHELRSSRWSNIPVVVISGDPAVRAAIPRLTQEGARDVFIKPFDTDVLIETIDSLLFGS